MNNIKIFVAMLLCVIFTNGYANDVQSYDDPKRLAKAKECIINNLEGDECQNIGFWGKDFIDLHYKTGNMGIIHLLTQKCESHQDILQGFSCYTLGWIFLKGRGVFGKGKGVEQNYAQALKYMKKACKLGDGLSCVYLGDLYLYGYGTKINIQLAREMYGKACDLENQAGCDKYNN